MNRNRVVRLLFLVVTGIFPALLACQSAAPASVSGTGPACSQQPFGYSKDEQKKWCGTCNSSSAKTQAPIDINTREAKPNDSLPELDFSGYESTTLVTSSNAHNLKVSLADSKSFLTIKKVRLKLDEFHFHRPGEEAINGDRPIMVIHLVHNTVGQVVPGGPVAITVMVKEGKPDPKTEELINKLIKNFPPPYGRREGVEINAADLLPSKALWSSYYRYQGSLTTPGCDEPLMFYVLKTPVVFSADQIAAFKKRYPSPNARDLQRRNGRIVEKTIDERRSK